VKIGVKYCGGCNPRYERSRLVQKISEAVGYPIVPAREADDWDVLLIIGGCANCCTDHAEHTAKCGKITVRDEGDYEVAVTQLRQAIADCTAS
jgi:4-hydroxybutyrate CoA-transferase